MKLYDLTQELYSCKVYPGDPAPQKQVLMSIAKGDVCNLTALSLCAHNGTHMDAPAHFLEQGLTIDQMPPEVFIGPCYLVRHQGPVTADQARAMLEKGGMPQRLLIAGDATVTEEAARVFAESGLLLLGNDSQTIGPADAPMAVHLVLLGAGVALLEGIVTEGVPEGQYLLSAAPLKLADGDGAPCRAFLIDLG